MDTVTIIYLVMFFFGIYFLLLFLILYQRNKETFYDYPKPTKFPTVSFIVPAYNEEDSIANTLNALLAINYPAGKKEIVVVNDESKDRTAEIVKSFCKKYPKIIKLLDKKNSGKADSVNQALKIVKGQLVAITDADSYPEPEALMKMVGYFEEDPEVAAVTSRVLVKNKKNFIEKFQDFDYHVIAWSRKVLDYIGCVYVTNGPLSIYQTALLREVGGFDTKNLTEDIEITWRLLSKGYKTKMSYDATVYTTTPSKFGRWINQRTRWNIGGLQTVYKYKNFFLRGKNLFGYFVISYVSLAFFLSLIGFFLLARYLWIKGVFYLFLTPAIFKGYNPFQALEFNFFFTLLFILGGVFFVLSFYYYSIAIKDLKYKSKSLLMILVYVFIYRPLYIIPYLISLYKLAKGDIGWYTK